LGKYRIYSLIVGVQPIRSNVSNFINKINAKDEERDLVRISWSRPSRILLSNTAGRFRLTNCWQLTCNISFFKVFCA
jgi:hypothetical protein